MGASITEIMVNQQRKYNKIVELEGITKQMTEVLERNDMFAFEMLVDMRTEIMLEVEQLDYTHTAYMQELPTEERTQVQLALSREVKPEELTTAELQRLHDIYSKTKRVLSAIIAMSDRMNAKLKGDRSLNRY